MVGSIPISSTLRYSVYTYCESTNNTNIFSIGYKSRNTALLTTTMSECSQGRKTEHTGVGSPTSLENWGNRKVDCSMRLCSSCGYKVYRIAFLAVNEREAGSTPAVTAIRWASVEIRKHTGRLAILVMNVGLMPT
jgi:hypothetical protein